jgi:hypothetical protein
MWQTVIGAVGSSMVIGENPGVEGVSGFRGGSESSSQTEGGRDVVERSSWLRSSW